jgi:hypothetical protein
MTATVVAMCVLFGLIFVFIAGFFAVKAYQILLHLRGRLRAIEDSVDAHFESLHAHLRQDHLLTMKATKGDSYVGTIGGVDVHTDPLLPVDHWLLRNPKAGGDAE